jgi:hypothetical protein
MNAFHRVHSHSHCTHCSVFSVQCSDEEDPEMTLEGKDGGGPAGKRLRQKRKKLRSRLQPNSSIHLPPHPFTHSPSSSPNCHSARPSNFLSKQRQAQTSQAYRLTKGSGILGLRCQWRFPSTRPPCRNRPSANNNRFKPWSAHSQIPDGPQSAQQDLSRTGTGSL